MIDWLLDRNKKPYAMVNFRTQGEFRDDKSRTQFVNLIQGLYCGARKISYDKSVGCGITLHSGIPQLTGIYDVSQYQLGRHILPLELVDVEGNSVASGSTEFKSNKLYVSPEIISELERFNRTGRLEKIVQE